MEYDYRGNLGSIGTKIRECRKAQGLTQKKLVKEVPCLGSAHSLSCLERKFYTPGVLQLNELSRFFGKPFMYWLSGNQENGVVKIEILLEMIQGFDDQEMEEVIRVVEMIQENRQEALKVVSVCSS